TVACVGESHFEATPQAGPSLARVPRALVLTPLIPSPFGRAQTQSVPSFPLSAYAERGTGGEDSAKGLGQGKIAPQPGFPAVRSTSSSRSNVRSTVSSSCAMDTKLYAVRLNSRPRAAQPRATSRETLS